MISETITLDHFQARYTLDLDISIKGTREFKSKLNTLVHEANTNHFAIECPDLVSLLTEHTPLNCNHHLHMCRRMDDPILEAATFIKAAVSSTYKYSHRGVVEVYINRI